MATLSLRISVAGSNANSKTMQFEPSTLVFDACALIRQKISEAGQGNSTDYGLFLADEDPKKGVWLDKKHTLEYYLLRNGDLLEYKKKLRVLRVKTMDESIKTMHVDDSMPVTQLMVTICSKMAITNHDEYSLIRELTFEEEKEKTLTLKRRGEKKMDEMKKKLHTDELNWLDHSKTLREQGIDENETLLLRRKFFFSDQNVDARDPVQLNLLYVQTRDAILKGAHPVNEAQAIHFAALQCQIQFGEHDENKHRPGFLDLKEFLPKEYVKGKSKEQEKKIYQEHRELRGTGLQDVEAKVKYTQLARSLKTYGITFFLVKEKVKGKNKLVPRLLGITKESVVRVDNKTKEIMKMWPLTCVKRWAASPNSFTLDFGDYSDSYYSVQTTEGEQISQLIGGYIDIILKKKRAADHLGIDGNEESFTFEDEVSPAKATIIQHQPSKVGQPQMGSVALPAVLRAAEPGQNQMGTGSMQKAMSARVSNTSHSGHAPLGGQNAQLLGLGQAQRALLGTIEVAIQTAGRTESELHRKADLPPELGQDAGSRKWMENQRDMSKQNIRAEMSAMNAATAQVVTETGQDEPDYTVVASAAAAISANLPEFSKDARLLAALEEEDNDGDRLLDAARRLAGAFSELLNAAQPDNQQPRQNLLTAANKIGEASQDIMKQVGDEDDENRAFEDALLALAKAVANTTATLVLKAKGVAGQTQDQDDKNRVIGSATQCALSTSQLVACTKVVAPTIQNPACQEQLVESAKQVARSVDHVVTTADDVCDDDNSLGDLREAATAVSRALDGLLKHIRTGSRGKQVAEVEIILTATDQLFHSMGDTSEMVRQARILAQATSQLVNALKGEAEAHPDSDQQKRLLAAAKALADATARMVEAAKGCASSPGDKQQQELLRQAAEDLKSATTVATSSAVKRQIIRNLEIAARNAASAATQCINAVGGCTAANQNQQSHDQLMEHCKYIADEFIPRLVQALKGSMRNPESTTAHTNLIHASHEMLPPGGKLVTQSKANIPTINDQALAMSLNNASRNLQAALAELRAAAGNAHDACGQLEIDVAIEQVRVLEGELQDHRRSAASGNLVPLPGDNAESASNLLGSTSKTVASSMAQLLTSAAQGNDDYTGIAAKDTASALTVLAKAVRAVAATTNDREIQHNILDTSCDVLDKSANLIEEAKKAVNNPNNPDNQARLAQVAKAVSMALKQCVDCLPGVREIDDAMRQMNAISQRLASGNFPGTDRTFQQVQMDLNNRAIYLNQAATDIVSASHSDEVPAASNRFSKAYVNFMDSGMEMAGVTREHETKHQIVSSLKSVSMNSSKLLIQSKGFVIDPNAPNSKNLLTQAARAVGESISHLMDVCTTSAPGQQECDNALRQMQAMRPLLENPTEPVSEQSYFEGLDGVIHRARTLAETMTGISNHAKSGELHNFCDNVHDFAGAVCGITESSAQAAYLVGIADSNSTPGRPGLVDQSQFARANQAIQMACSNLSNPAVTQQQVLSAATVIAKHTSALCNTCRMASSKTNNPVAKRHFVQSAKDVANSTANLVRSIKALDSDFSDENRRRCAEAARPLTQAVDELTTFASSPEFASVPARISPQARQAQEPIASAGLQLIDGACNMVQAAKHLAVNPKDPPTYQQYSGHSHSVSEAIKQLVVAIRDSAPGQQECDIAAERINHALRVLDQASLAAIGQNLEARNENSLQGFQEHIVTSAKELLAMMEELRSAAKGEPEKLGHIVTKMVGYTEPLAYGAVGAASRTNNSQRQMTILDQSKTVAESLLQLTLASKESGGNPKASQHHAGIDECVDTVKENLQEYLATIEEAASAAGIVSTMVENITTAMQRMDERLPTSDGMAYVDFQTNMVHLGKQIATNSQDMVGKSSTNVQAMGPLGQQITHDYNQLADQARGAIATTSNLEAGQRLKQAIQELGVYCVQLVQDGGRVHSDPSDGYARKGLGANARKVTERVAQMLAVLQQGAKGTQACINASHTVSGIIGDLDTTIMFATAGTLNTDSGETFADHRENILKTAKALVEDTKTLVAGAASNQEQLAAAAQSAVMTITRLAECVKQGAASLGSEQPDAQVLLINAVKDVAAALGDLISATKNASGKSAQDPAMGTLKDSAKVMVTNVTSLLKTVKTVEDETARGTRALEASIEAITQDIRSYVQTDRVEKTYTPEELIRYITPFTMATAKAVAAGNSCKQEDVIVAANMGRKSVYDVLRACKGASTRAETQELKFRVLEAGKNCSILYKDLLEQVALTIQKPNAENKNRLLMISKQVASSVTEIRHASECLKGTDWVDPHDPTVIAEAELLSAAHQIEAAAKKLALLQPRSKPKEVNEELNFEEQILEAAKSIAAATAALVKAASAAQQELISQGRIGAYYENADDDSQWSQGLISAARLVAAATHSLCDAANAMVQGHSSEEKLISAAKQVAASTAQLLVACKVKADVDSMAMRRLQAAGNAVKRATEALVRAAQQASNSMENNDPLMVNERMVGGIAQIIQAQQEIIEREKELESARKKLEAIRKAKYKDRPPTDYESGSDF